MNEWHGALWRECVRWKIVYERLDPATDALGVVLRHKEFPLLRADLYLRVDYGEPDPLPTWDGCAEALFGPDDLPEAIKYLDRILRDRSGASDFPTTTL